MRTYRIAALLAATTAATAMAVTTPPAGAAPPATEPGYHGPACGDVTDGTALYDGAQVQARMILAALPCRTVTYRLTVTDGPFSTAVIASTTGAPPPTGGTAVVFDAAVTDPTPGDGVCVYVTTSRGGRVFDRAPDNTDCVPLVVDGGVGGQGFH